MQRSHSPEITKRTTQVRRGVSFKDSETIIDSESVELTTKTTTGRHVEIDVELPHIMTNKSIEGEFNTTRSLTNQQKSLRALTAHHHVSLSSTEFQSDYDISLQGAEESVRKFSDEAKKSTFFTYGRGEVDLKKRQTSYDSEVNGELNIISLSRGIVLRILYTFFPCACSVNLLEFSQLTLPGYTRNFDQISDFIVFWLFYDKFFIESMMLFLLALLAICIRWYVSLRHVKIEEIPKLPFYQRVSLFIYIIPVFGLPLYLFFDLLDSVLRPLCCFHNKRVSLMLTEDPENVINKMEFDSFVELFVESAPASVIGLTIFFNYTVQNLEVGSGSFYFEVSILFLSTSMSIYNVIKTSKRVLSRAKRHGFTMLQYVYHRLQFTDLEMSPMFPFLGGLQRGTTKHCNFAGHKFRPNDVTMLENLIAPELHPETAPAISLQTVQLSPYCMQNLHHDTIFRLARVFHRRKIIEDTLNWDTDLVLYVVRIQHISDFQNMWHTMDEDESGLVDIDEFKCTHDANVDAFIKLSPNEKTMYRQDFFNAILFDSTGRINGISHVDDILFYAVKEGPPKFMTFCVGLKCHLKSNKCYSFNVGQGVLRDFLTFLLEVQRPDKVELLQTAVKYDKQLIRRSVEFHALMNDEENLTIIMNNSDLIHQCGTEGIQEMMQTLATNTKEFDERDITLLACSFMNLTMEQKKELAETMIEKMNASNYDHLLSILNSHDLLHDFIMELAKQGIALGMPDMLKKLDELSGGLQETLDFKWLGNWPIFKYVLDQMKDSVQFILQKLPEQGSELIQHEVERRFWEWIGQGFPDEDKQELIQDLVLSYPPVLLNKLKKQRHHCLSFAIAAGNFWLLDQLLLGGADINMKNEFNLTALGMMYTLDYAQRDERMMGRILGAENVDVNVKTFWGFPVLIVACADVDVPSVETLLSMNADINLTGPNGYAFLHALCKFHIRYDEDDSDTLVSEDESIELTARPTLKNMNTVGMTVLQLFGSEVDMMAENTGADENTLAEVVGTFHNSPVMLDTTLEDDFEYSDSGELELGGDGKSYAVVEQLKEEVEGDIQPAQQNVLGEGKSPLASPRPEQRTRINFTRARWTEMKDLALQSESLDIDLVAKDGKSPLLLAIENEHSELAFWLIDKGCNVNGHDMSQYNIFRAAIESQVLEVIPKLIEHAAEDSSHPEGTGLLLSVKEIKAELVEQLLNAKSDVNATDCDEMTPLMHAAKLGVEDTMIILLREEDININAQNSKKQTALILATIQENTSMVEMLLNHNADIGMQDHKRHTALYYALKDGMEDIIELFMADLGEEVGKHSTLTAAIKAGDEGVVERLLEAGSVDINALDKGENTLLILAASQDMYSIVLRLIDMKADVNAANALGSTALMNAVSKENEEMITILLKAGANPGRFNDSGISSLAWACQHQMENIIPLLLKSGVHVDQENERLETALHFAAQQQNTSVMQVLLQNGADPNNADEDGNTALLLAADTRNHTVIELLLKQQSIDVNHRNKLGHTPLIVSIWKKDLIMMRMLFEKNADPDVADEDGWTALMYACFDGGLSLVKYLVEDLQADVTLKNNDGKSCIDIAIEQNQRGICGYLGKCAFIDDKDKISLQNYKKKTKRKRKKQGLLGAAQERTLEFMLRKKREDLEIATGDNATTKKSQIKKFKDALAFGGIGDSMDSFGPDYDSMESKDMNSQKPLARPTSAFSAIRTRPASVGGGITQLFGKDVHTLRTPDSALGSPDSTLRDFSHSIPSITRQNSSFQSVSQLLHGSELPKEGELGFYKQDSVNALFDTIAEDVDLDPRESLISDAANPFFETWGPNGMRNTQQNSMYASTRGVTRSS